jgi:hypothetical protein
LHKETPVSDPKIVASARDAGRRAPVQGSEQMSAWSTLGWVGLVFLVVGGADFVLVWFPPNFGTREWEFATVTQSFNGLPILLLGVGLLVVGSEQAERPWWLHLAGGVAAVLLLWVLVALGFWASNVGLALETVPPELRGGIEKAVAKTVIQAVAYPVLLVYLLRRVWIGRPGRVSAA